MKIVDAKGLSCPQPLILTRKTLAAKAGDFRMVLDDQIARKNIERFLKHENQSYKITETAEEIWIDISNDNSAEPTKENEQSTDKPVYVFKTKGVAPDQLGQMLTAGFFATLKEVQPLPEAIVFYHEAVFLTLDDSAHLPVLQELQDLGVKIMICGNCVKFYDLVERVAIGEISNAFDILTLFSNAHHLVYP